MKRALVTSGWSLVGSMLWLMLAACQGPGETPAEQAAGRAGRAEAGAAPQEEPLKIPDSLLATVAGPAPADIAALRQKSAAIEAGAGALQTEHSVDADEAGGPAVSFTLYRNDNELRMAEETIGDTSGGDTTFANYYFDGGRLFRYQAFASQAGQDVAIDLYFDDRGKLLKAAKQVDGREVTVADGEVTAVTRRAGELLGR